MCFNVSSTHSLSKKRVRERKPLMHACLFAESRFETIVVETKFELFEDLRVKMTVMD